MQNWYDKAIKFNILGTSTLNLQEEILANLNAGLLTGDIKSSNMEKYLKDTITLVCKSYHKPPKPDQQLLKIVDSSLSLLTKDIN